MLSRPSLNIPDLNIILFPGTLVKLGRFDSIVWAVGYGWYSWGGNRPVCGWYLTKQDDPEVLKPLQMTDLDDIYCVKK